MFWWFAGCFAAVLWSRERFPLFEISAETESTEDSVSKLGLTHITHFHVRPHLQITICVLIAQPCVLFIWVWLVRFGLGVSQE